MSGKSLLVMSRADRRQVWLDRLNRFADSGTTRKIFASPSRYRFDRIITGNKNWLRRLLKTHRYQVL
jgi:hypothetical protein